MPDDLSKKCPQDATKINIFEPWELEYWSRHFAVTKVELVEAVKQVGTSVEVVRRYLWK